MPSSPQLNFSHVLNASLLPKRKKKKKKKTWAERTKLKEAQWEENRADVFEAVIGSYLFEGLCHSCFKNPVSVKCRQCLIKWICFDCDERIHSTETLHDRVGYLDGFRKPLTTAEFIGSDSIVNEKGMCCKFMHQNY